MFPPQSGSMSAYPTMPLGTMAMSGASFGGPGMSPTPPMPPPMGTMQPMSSFPAQGGMPPGSFQGMPSGNLPFNGMGSMPPGTMPPPGSMPDHHTAGNDPLGMEKPTHLWIKFGEFSPIYPTPETPQYGVWGKDMALQRVEKKQEMFCSKLGDFGTWGRANLRGICDTATMSWKERMINAWCWTYIHVDGWNLNFWPPEFMDAKDTGKDDRSVNPTASVDIRQIITANYEREASSSEGATAPFVVRLNFQTGYFPFRVLMESEAQAWCVRIMKGVVETVKVQQLREKCSGHMNKMDELDVDEHRIEKDPVRMARLRELWQKAVEAVERGSKPSKQMFAELYGLYDVIEVAQEYEQNVGRSGQYELQAPRGDGNLTMYEIEVLCREFLEMKNNEVRRIVVQQEKELYHQFRSVTHSQETKLRWTIDQGRDLMEQYRRQLNPQDFFDRVVNFHHKTDYSHDGRVDLQEFCNAVPIFLMPNLELRKEGLFFAAAQNSDSQAHYKERGQDDAHGEDEEQEGGGCGQQ